MLNRSTEINGNLMSSARPIKFLKSFPRYAVALSLSFFLLVHLAVPKAIAQEKSSRAYVIKAGFIYNFTRFVKWPPQPNKNSADYSVCVLGDNPFGSILKRLEEKTRLKERPLKIKLNMSRNDIRGCDILFISFSERFNIEQIVKQAEGLPVLTVGDTAGYAERGIGINLLVVENKVQFEINKQCLDVKGFRVSSELLDLATLVEGGC